MTEIDKLIEKYFDGETSLQEEKTLRDYFIQTSIADRHKMYAPMFNFFAEERNDVKPMLQKPKRRASLYYMWAGIAAAMMLVVGIRFMSVSEHNNDTMHSMVYIDGKKVSDRQTINTQALISISNVADVDTEVLDTQISILDSFTD